MWWRIVEDDDVSSLVVPPICTRLVAEVAGVFDCILCQRHELVLGSYPWEFTLRDHVLVEGVVIDNRS